MATLDTFQSDVLLGTVGSSDGGYNTDTVDVTYQATMRMGAALELSAPGGPYVWVADAAAAVDCTAILIDIRAEAYDGEVLAPGAQRLVVAKRGCTINANKITTVDGAAPAILAADLAFEAAGANKVTDQVVGNQ